MTWNQFWIEVRKRCSCDAFADNIVGRLMDDYESWEWEALVPDSALEVLR